MRISDWSSDVCSSDLPTDSLSVHFKAGWTKANGDTSNENFIEFAGPGAFSYDLTSGRPEVSFANPDPLNPAGIRPDFGRIQSVTNDDEEKYFYLDVEKQDRKSVVEGKSVSVRVELGGRRIIKKT